MPENGVPLLLDRYQILSKIGEGATAKIYKAFDTRLGRTVAIKEIPSNPNIAPRAIREARTVATLNHPNIVTVFEFEEEDKYYYLIMEFLEGVSLRQILSDQGTLSVSQSIAVATQVLSALEYAHSNEIIHRDIKPENIMILKDGRVKVTDFGIARLIGREHQEKRILGTLGYMSPEQVTGRYVDEVSDIFSVGVVLYEMLVGKNPLYADTLKSTALKILNLDPPPPSSINSRVPQDIDSIVLKSIAKDPDVRFQTAAEMRLKLEIFQAEKVTSETLLKDMAETFSAAHPEPQAIISEKKPEALPLTVSRLIRRYEEHEKRAVIAVAVAVLAWWEFALFPFYPASLSQLIPLVLFLVTLSFPLPGIWLSVLVVLPPLFKFSLGLGFVAIPFFAVLLALGQEEEIFSVSPLGAPFFAFLKIGLFFPLLIGLTCTPVVATILSGLGALTLEFFDLLGPQRSLRYFSLTDSYQILAALKDSDSLFSAFKIMVKPLVEQPVLIAQIALWSLVSLVISGLPYIVLKRRPYIARYFALFIGTLILIFGYTLLPGLLADFAPSQNASSFQAASVSLASLLKKLILPILLGIIVVPIIPLNYRNRHND